MKLTNKNIKIYKNDINGNIIAKSDGNNITFSTKPTDVTINNYIGNKNSNIFHKPNCSSLPMEKNRVYFKSRNNAINAEHKACSIM